MVLVLAEHQNGAFKHAAFSAVTAGAQYAQAAGVDCVALVLGSAADAAQLGTYGASRVIVVDHASLAGHDSRVQAHAISAIAGDLGASLVLLSHTTTGKAILGRLAVRLNCGFASGVSAFVPEGGNVRIERSAFSGKAIESYLIGGSCAVISMMPNAIPPAERGGPCPVETASPELPASATQVREVKRLEGEVPLPEADLVVSAGRGMKDPSNWGIIEDLAKVLHAATACSRPVADSGWRPHHEHVGQTGIAIRPNLYVAIGISGAIQHLAGVNNSKVIVVINKDPEAPFFKAADYGVCGDLFEVVPRLTESLRKAGYGA